MATVASTTDGNWTAGATWVGGSVPADGDTVWIDDTVTFDEDDALKTYAIIDIRAGGTLTWDTTKDTSLRISSYWRIPGVAGKLEIGTEATPIGAAFTAEIIADGTDGGPYFQGWGSADIEIVGAAKTNHTTLTAAITATDTDITVAAATGWLVGDEIAVENTDTYTDAANTEKVTVTGVAGLTISYSTGFANAHADGARVVNLTRNVVFSSVDATHRWGGSQCVTKFSDNVPAIVKNVEIRGDCVKTSDYTAFMAVDGSSSQNIVVEGVSQNEQASGMLIRPGTASDVGITATECVGYGSYFIYRSFNGCGGVTFKDCVWMNYTKSNGSVYQSDGVSGYATSFNNCVFSNCVRPIYLNSGDGGGLAFNSCEVYATTTASGVFISAGVANVIFRSCEFSIGPGGSQANNANSVEIGRGGQALFSYCKLVVADVTFNQRVATGDYPVGFEHYNQTINDHRFYSGYGDAQFQNAASPKAWIINSTNSSTWFKMTIPVYVKSTDTAITLYGTKASTTGWTREPRMDVYGSNGLLEDSVLFDDNDTSRHQQSATITPTRDGLYLVRIVCQNASSDFTVDSIEVT